MAIITNTVNYLDGDTILQGFFAFDDSDTALKPAVLVCPTWAGRDSFAESKAQQLAGLGYLGFAVDMYGGGKVGASPEENASLMQPFIDDRGKLQKRITAALAAVQLLPWVDSRKTAAIGFCFGGLCVLDLARTGAGINGVVSFHGLLGPTPAELKANPITAKILALHGNDDPMVSDAQLAAFKHDLTVAKADWQLHVYGHTVHAFTNPNANNPSFGTVYNPVAEQRAWLAMRHFLQEIFI